jgi:uncharacterized SAM-binding protein YcdF (DUF218 family)
VKTLLSPARAAALALLLAAALVGGWAARERLLAAVGGFLVAVDPPAKADALLVLSGEVAERAREAADLHREGWARTVVLTTPELHRAEIELRDLGIRIPEEHDVAREVLLHLGVPPGEILRVPEAVDSTEAEALAARAFARARGWRRVIVVTSPYHTRRARSLFREVFGKAGIEVRVVASRHARFRPATWWRDRYAVRLLVIEYEKLLFYALPGHER